MDISKINPFAATGFAGVKGVEGIQTQQQPVSAISQTGKNPFASARNDDSMVGIGIKDGAVQTSAAQMGKPAAQMRQIGIA